MAGLTPVATRLISTTSAGHATIVAEVGLVPNTYATYAASTSSIWSVFNSIAPSEYANDAGGPYRAYLRATSNQEDWLFDLPIDVIRYAERLGGYYDEEPTAATYWSRQNIAELSPSTAAVVTTVTITVTAGRVPQSDTGRHDTSPNLVVIAIVLPFCLVALFLFLGFLLWYYRRRIVEYLHKKYNVSSEDPATAYHFAEIKQWPPITDSVSTTSVGGIRPDVDTSSSSRPDPCGILRIKGRQNTADAMNHSSDLNRDRHRSAEQLHSYVAYRPRCPTPDTPLSRRDQLANRSEEIKEVHTRLGSSSPEPHTIPELDATDHVPVQPQSGRGLLRSASEATYRKVSPQAQPMSPCARPTSPTGSIRLVDRNSKDMGPHKRVPSDAIGRRLEEAFMPDWQPEGASRLPSS